MFFRKLFSFNEEEVKINLPDFKIEENNKNYIDFNKLKEELGDYFFKDNNEEKIMKIIIGINGYDINNFIKSIKEYEEKFENLDYIINLKINENKPKYFKIINNLKKYDKKVNDILLIIENLKSKEIKNKINIVKNNKTLIIFKNKLNSYLNYLNKLKILNDYLKNNSNLNSYKYLLKIDYLTNFKIIENLKISKEKQIINELITSSDENYIKDLIIFFENNKINKFKDEYELFDHIIKEYILLKKNAKIILNIFYELYDNKKLDETFKQILNIFFFEKDYLSIWDIKIIINYLNDNKKYENIKDYLYNKIYLKSLNNKINKNNNNIILNLSLENGKIIDKYNFIKNLNINLEKILDKNLEFDINFFVDKKVNIFIDNIIQNIKISKKYEIDNNLENILIVIIYFNLKLIVLNKLDEKINIGNYTFFNYIYNLNDLIEFLDELEQKLNNHFNFINDANLFKYIKENIIEEDKKLFNNIVDKLYCYNIIQIIIYLINILGWKFDFFDKLIRLFNGLLEIILNIDYLDKEFSLNLFNLKSKDILNYDVIDTINEEIDNNFEKKLKIFKKCKIFLNDDQIIMELNKTSSKQLLDFLYLTDNLDKYKENLKYYEKNLQNSYLLKIK